MWHFCFYSSCILLFVSGSIVSSLYVCGYTLNKNTKKSSFKSSETIKKKQGGPDSTVSNNQFSLVTLNELAMIARDRAYYNFKFQRGSQSKD